MRTGAWVVGTGLAMAITGVHALEDKETGRSGSATAYWNMPRGGEQYVTGIVGANIGALRLETRVNYEARRAASVFAGWTFAGGETLTYAATPIVGWVGGDVQGPIAGLEASLALHRFDYYIEIEYVHDQHQASTSYLYAWSELAYRPLDWLRLGMAVQRTRAYGTARELQRGAFAQVTVKRATAGVYWFNPGASERLVILSLGLSF